MIATYLLQGPGVFIVKVLTKTRCLSRHPYLLRRCRQAQRGGTRRQSCLRKLSGCHVRIARPSGSSSHTLAINRTIADPLPTNKLRNVIFLGWGANYGRKYLRDCKSSPSALPNLIARVYSVMEGLKSFGLTSAPLPGSMILGGMSCTRTHNHCLLSSTLSPIQYFSHCHPNLTITSCLVLARSKAFKFTTQNLTFFV